MRLTSVFFAVATLATGCAQRVRMSGQDGVIAVRVVNPTIRSSEGPGTWVNDCQPIARLGASETRIAWLGRIEDFIEGRSQRLASITYPPGDGVDVALICFSTHAD